MPATLAQKASTDDAQRKQEALTYLRELKERLKNKKATYDEFLEIMKEFKAQRCASVAIKSASSCALFSRARGGLERTAATTSLD
jgi:hypothetical protein